MKAEVEIKTLTVVVAIQRSQCILCWG